MTKKHAKQTKSIQLSKEQAIEKLSDLDKEILNESYGRINNGDEPARIERVGPAKLKPAKITGNSTVDNDVLLAKVAKHYGITDPYLGIKLFTQLATVCNGDEDKINSAISLVNEINPQNGVEAMLVNQMVSIHMLTMICGAQAASSDQTLNGAKLYFGEVNKLARTFAAQMAALNKHRGKGQQKMTVEHVHVNEGGQAVIGNVDTGGNKPARVKGGNNSK